MSLDPQWVRSHFPSVVPSETIFLDNPGGTQVTQSVIDAVAEYFLTANANHGGVFPTSERSDEMIHHARLAFADFLNAARPEEIVFGPNMTTLTFSVARALGRWLNAGDEIIVTRLDHDANIAPWVALEERGVVIKRVDINTDDCTLDMSDFEKQLSNKTRIVAVGLASNAVGSVNPVRTIADLAHMAGAFVFADAVAYAPHYPLDVQELGVDFLACSAYKFYGPHLGILYGKYEHLERLRAYKVRPAENVPPHKFETGTPTFENIHAAAAAVNYLASVGETFGAPFAKDYAQFQGRRLHLKTAMRAIQQYEKNVFIRLMQGLREIPNIHLYGITDLARFDYRAPTAAFNFEGLHPRDVAAKLGKQNINVWDGNYYALSLMERLDLEATGGAVRVGLAHYNTNEEIDKLLQVLNEQVGR
ncbi:MAG: cysteine desulfurase-like protein [Chloroflexota bacterium]|nr:MAG: cysteine desulfurase-like protein [Chloroflexota bacterium]